MIIRAVVSSDHSRLLALWERTPGVRIRPEDAFEPFCRYLRRNPQLSLLAEDAEGLLIGCLIVGHDGRRGYLQHLVVEPRWRGRGLARRLIGEALGRLAGEGVTKSHVFVLADAPEALDFWCHQADWEGREDIRVFSSRAVAGS